MAELIYKDECYKIYGLCYGIHNSVGSVLNERQYQEIVEAAFKEEKIPFEREKELYFKLAGGTRVGGNTVDFVAWDKIAIDLKAKKFIMREDFRQMMRYLRAGNYKLGLIVNFRGNRVTIKRVVNSAIRI